MEAAGIPVPAASTAGSESEDDGVEGEEEEELESDPLVDETMEPKPEAEAPPPLTDLTASVVSAPAAVDAGELVAIARPTKKPKKAPTETKATPETPTETAVAPTVEVPTTAPTETREAPSKTGEPPSAKKKKPKTPTMLRLKHILEEEASRKRKKDVAPSSREEAGVRFEIVQPTLAGHVHVVVRLDDGLYECQACGLMGDLATVQSVQCDGRRQAKMKELEKIRELTLALQEMKRQRLYEREAAKASAPIDPKPSNPKPSNVCTDNLDTQVWMEDSQPPWEPVSETKPSKPKVSAATKPEICAEPESAATATRPEITTTGAKPESAAAATAPEITTTGANAESVAVATQVASKGKPPRDTKSKQAICAVPSLPEKPSCMKAIPASLCPNDQKHKKKEEVVEEEEDDEAKAEGDGLDGDALTDAPDDEPEDFEYEDDDDEEGEAESQGEQEEEEHMKVMRRPAAKAKAKAKAKARGGRPKSKAAPKKKAGKASPKKAPAKGKPRASPKKAPAKSKRKNEDEDAANSKALKSRKSVAYHKARTEALAAGMSVEEASDIAKE
ncbi:unnamed protein product, partial [Symbiodinium necroappetens]